MYSCLYFICPTDSIENIINKTFKQENYFYTSLGNSFVCDKNTIEYLKKIIKKHKIREIYFVLSIDNKIVLDALGQKKFIKVRTLNTSYNEIRRYRKGSKLALRKSKHQFTILSYYLNKKIKELELHLVNTLQLPIKINGKIYNRNAESFATIYSNLVCLEKYHFN